MHRVFLIAPAFLAQDLEEALAGSGADLVRYKSVRNAIHAAPDPPDLIIIDRKQSRDTAPFREFMKRYRFVPKVVFTEEGAFDSLRPWTRQDLTYFVSRPSSGELTAVMRKAFNARSIETESRELKEKLKQVKQELELFEGVSRALTSSLELDEMLGAIMRSARKLIAIDGWTVFLIDEETGDLVSERSMSGGDRRKKPARTRVRQEDGIIGWVAREGMPVVLPDVSNETAFSQKIAAAPGLKTKSVMCVPILSKGKPLGVIQLMKKNQKQPYSKEDLVLMLRIVDRAAIAIERASLYQKMAELSITDDLTKLFNTRYLNRTLETEIARAGRHQTSLSLIFMDIDYFKLVNDNYGHLVGSKLLVEMAQLLIRCLRSVDIVARFGGDEFVMVLPSTSAKNAVQIAERIRKSIEQNIFLKNEGYTLKLTASFGVASYPDSARSKDDLLRLADEAMYRVKNRTRNGVYAIV